MSDDAKLRAELTGAILGIEGRYSLSFDRLQAQVAADDYPGAIRSATECIEIVNGLFRDYKEQFAVNPRAAGDYNGDLVTLYGTRGAVRLDYARAGGPKRETLLELAEADIDKALSFPPVSYRAPGMRSSLLDAKKLIQKERGTGQAGSSGKSEKSDKCFIATATYGSTLAPEVVTLRRFREARLRPYLAGRWLICAYERFSPPLASAIATRPTARRWVRRLLLAPIIGFIRRKQLDMATCHLAGTKQGDVNE